MRPVISRSIACWISASESESRLEVASSRIRIGASATEGARQRDTLPLATRQLHAAFADERRIAARQPRDEVVRIGELRRALDLRLRRRWPRMAVLSGDCDGTGSAPAGRSRSASAATAASHGAHPVRRSAPSRPRRRRAAGRSTKLVLPKPNGPPARRARHRGSTTESRVKRRVVPEAEGDAIEAHLARR